MSGSLFKNDRKQNENHPDYSGTAEIDGKQYWISGWLKKSQRGDFFSLAFKPKDAGGEFKQMRQAAGPAPSAPASAALPKEEPADSDLPF